MILRALLIENFRNYNHASIEFPEGIIGVIGLNGSGKSTIFEAIAWALFGSVAARTCSEDIKRNSAEPSSSCLVDICFEFEGDEYRVVRQMKGKNLVSTATVTKNEKIIATSAGTSAEYIQKLLGMDYKSFFTSIFAKQKELNTLSSMNASERRPLILKMLGVDSLDDVIKQINSDKRSKTTLISHLEKSLLDKQGMKKQTILSNQEKDLKYEYHKTSTELREMKKNLQQIKTNQKIQQSEIKNAKKRYEDINKEYETSIKQKIVFEQFQKIKDERTVIEKKLSNREKTIHSLEHKQSDIIQINDELLKLTNNITALHQHSKELIQLNAKQKGALDHIKEHKKEIDNKKGSMKELGSDAPCPTCERELGSQFQFLLNKYQQKKVDLEKNIKTIEKDIQKSTDKQKQTNNQLTVLKKKKEIIRKKQAEQKELKIKLESQLYEKKSEEKELEKIVKQIQNTPPIDFNKNTYETIHLQRKKIYHEYQILIKKGNTAKDTLSKKVLEVEKIQSLLTLLKQKITSVKKQRLELTEMQETITVEQKNVTEISLLQDVMSAFRLHLISRIRPALSQYASSFFHDLTDGKYSEMDLDEHYNIYIYDDGEKYPIQRFSGGEIDLANLCLRLAISDIITERAEGLFHFIVLDEIFGSQDRFRQQNIMQELYKLSSTFKQIFLITHVEDVKHYMQHIIQVEEINDESKISIN